MRRQAKPEDYKPGAKLYKDGVTAEIIREGHPGVWLADMDFNGHNHAGPVYESLCKHWEVDDDSQDI